MKHLNRADFITAFDRLHPGLSVKALSLNMDLSSEYDAAFNEYVDDLSDEKIALDREFRAMVAIWDIPEESEDEREARAKNHGFHCLKENMSSYINDHAYSQVSKDLALSIANLFQGYALFSITIGTNTLTSAVDFIGGWNRYHEDDQIDLYPDFFSD